MELSKSLKQTQNAEIKIIISHHGQIIDMYTTEFAMLPIPNSEMSSEAINRMHLKNIYSANVFVDNLGNVIVASDSKTIIIDPSLEHVFEMNTDIQGTCTILSTAVDQQNQLWIGTEDETLYIVKYLRQLSGFNLKLD